MLLKKLCYRKNTKSDNVKGRNPHFGEQGVILSQKARHIQDYIFWAGTTSVAVLNASTCAARSNEFYWEVFQRLWAFPIPAKDLWRRNYGSADNKKTLRKSKRVIYFRSPRHARTSWQGRKERERLLDHHLWKWRMDRSQKIKPAFSQLNSIFGW